MSNVVERAGWRQTVGGFLRRRLTFSLRTLLLVVTAICLWLGRQSYLAREQREAVAAIRSLNDRDPGIAMVGYDFQREAFFKSRYSNMNYPPPSDASSQIFGVDFNHRAEFVWLLGGVEMRAEMLVSLKRLPHLKEIFVWYNVLGGIQNADRSMEYELQRELPDVKIIPLDIFKQTFPNWPQLRMSFPR